MRHHLRFVAVLAVALVAYGVLIQALRWMSQPSDGAWYGGIAIILGLFLLVPILLREIWRRL